MASIGHKLETKGVIMTLLSLVLISTGCEEQIDSPAVNPSEEKMIEVTLNIGFAEEIDAASFFPTTKSGNESNTFDVQFAPYPKTKTVANNHPDQLYNLEVCQYNTEGVLLQYKNLGIVNPGTNVSFELNNLEDCQLFFLARGSGNVAGSINGKSLDGLNDVIASSETIEKITDINQMPYFLHLEKVKIVDGKLQSIDGKDARILMKRLAVRLSISWEFSKTLVEQNYSLREVRLFQKPKQYSIRPKREETKWGIVYPGGLTDFIDGFRLTGSGLSSANGHYEVWVPANAQGSASIITSSNYRTKEYVNPATSYIEFVVDHTAVNGQNDQRLYYRTYLGGNTTTDLNLVENTNYHWIVKINTADFIHDPRIRLLDQTPVKSTNIVPAANCFMMVPGTNICFNPYKHTSGTNEWNYQLTDGNTLNVDKTITDVKVIWQTKDAGTVGELVLGYAIDQTTNHKNLANIESGNSLNDARISVKAPVTRGGNALVAAISLECVNYSEIPKTDGNTLAWVIEHPKDIIIGTLSWYNDSETTDASVFLWDNQGKKTLYDPCPDGWMIPDKSVVNDINTANAYWFNANGNFVQNGSSHTKGGRLYNISGTPGIPTPQTIHNTVWFPVTAWRGNGVLTQPDQGYLGFRNMTLYSGYYRFFYSRYSNNEWTNNLQEGGRTGESNPFRCVQE
ncbi:DUF4906 domain-containing protein [Parabacteroides goldsteinii]|uniref:DUF4906 domain-containing protein n=1 Tax=Parabacteroides goldsteinii TaxID=328812 RepID=A0A6G1ZLX8_9BACT|nr:DUF4906 domain-containing protein [Parabacteroides goldsteinii]MRX95290.1 DUF4906 domain-containing protein [Parabacteroides goldsteinii]MRX97408.1 DUF4906 domain-containing protein [Parabacteroides goldsteinii]MRY05640.1 DUF4906 domain-containing protein [Parabacteroides goldsteinii]MRY14947.1 DUF4906 domain-containing protein [Parabacteroides goldsteinii]MRY24105.1 DUF4906 domain-containing protein [Parabacteroides goldsteinii]